MQDGQPQDVGGDELDGSGERAQMRPFSAARLATFKHALELAAQLAQPVVRSEVLPLVDSAQRVLVEDVTAQHDVPAIDRAAMDGYAVRAGDVQGATAESVVVLECRGRVAAGASAATGATGGHVAVQASTCVEIATGAPLPSGADAVVPVEWTSASTSDGGATTYVTVARSLDPGRHVSVVGEDLARGDRVAQAGQIVGAALTGAIAAAGRAQIRVRCRPRVLVVATGDEVVSLGEELAHGQVHDSNAAALLVMLRGIGAEVEQGEIASDTPEALTDAIRRPGFDLVVTTGGTSVGRRDLVVPVIEGIGDVLLHGVAAKPGKPLLLARVGDRPVVGLPGFAASCLMLAYALLRPMVARLGGGIHVGIDGKVGGRGTAWDHFRTATAVATLTDPVRSPRGKTQLLPVAIDVDRGRSYARPTYSFSSAVTSLSRAHGWVEIEPDIEELPAGAEVAVHPF